ncbi:MAG: MBL fold metallo-hydrolase [Candidatus Aenigmarchaeota archaeon]|nr:MBL fold metallo-hydrolase [Candidatus Aenigmarchaeota archaeon]
MEIEILGAAREVGRSAISIRDGKTNIIMDYGVKLQEIEDVPELTNGAGKKDAQPRPPMPAKRVSAVFLSHAHLDHCGALPILYKKESPPLYATAPSLELANMMLKDSMKIAKKEKYKLAFGKKEVEKMNKGAKSIDYNQPVKIGDFTCTLFDAGHIPGSAGIFLKHRSGLTIFYTGDINTAQTLLLKPCMLPNKANVLIIDSTYAMKDHPDREQEKNKFLTEVNLSAKTADTCIIPVFALGRPQEVLLMLEKHTGLISIDGMAKEASEIILKHKKYIKDPKRLSRILENIAWIYSDEEREIAIKQFPIIITTAGMMTGGPVLFYLRNIKSRPETKVLFTGYLIKNTPAKKLIETGTFSNEKESYKVLSARHQFDFSAHAGRSGLMHIIKTLRPKHVISVHGENCQEFAKDIMTEFSRENSAISQIKAYAPKAGEVIRI